MIRALDMDRRFHPSWLGLLRRSGGIFLLTLVLGACGGGRVDDDPDDDSAADDDTSDRLCEPETEQPCACADDRPGVQQCLASGYGWGGCQCSADDNTTSDEGGTSGSDEGSSGEGDGTAEDDTGTEETDESGSEEGDQDSAEAGETGTADEGGATDQGENDGTETGEDSGSGGDSDTGGDSDSDSDSGGDSDGDSDGDGGTGTGSGLEIAGDYIDEHGFDHHITSSDWTTVFGLYYVHAYDNGEHWAILFNDPVSWAYPFYWSRFEWEWTADGRFWYCPVTGSGESREEVETIERPDHGDPPSGGCNGEPWIELIPR